MNFRKSFIHWMVALGIITMGVASTINAQYTVHPEWDMLPATFYKHFSGTVAGQPVSVVLQQMNDDLLGYYWDMKHKKRISLAFDPDSSHNGQLFFYENTTGAGQKPDDAPVWKVHYTNGKIIGMWMSAGRQKTYRIRLEEGYTNDMLPFAVIAMDTVVYASPRDTSSASIDIELALVKAGIDTLAAGWLNKQIQQISGYKSAFSMIKNMSMRVDSTITEYRRAVDDRPNRDSPIWNWTQHRSLGVHFNRNNYVILRKAGYWYSGGAHGGAYVINYCFDLKNKKQLQLHDIVTADSTVLSQLLEQQFREKVDLAPTDSLNEILFENKLMPNDNFSFSHQGLVFTYNQYEVAPYVMGIITITIPWDKLKGYIRPEFAERMHLQLNRSSNILFQGNESRWVTKQTAVFLVRPDKLHLINFH